MDTQIAAEFLGTLLQIAGTFLAVHIAIVVFVLQDEILSLYFLKTRVVWFTYGASIFYWIVVITRYLMNFRLLNPESPYNDNLVSLDIIMLMIGLGFMLVIFVFILMDRMKIIKEKGRLMNRE